MGKDTKISWANHTFNPWMGCDEVSPGCDNCYAKVQVERWKKSTWGHEKEGGSRTLTSPQYWSAPIQWNQQAARDKIRRRVFVASLADIFENWQGPMRFGFGPFKDHVIRFSHERGMYAAEDGLPEIESREPMLTMDQVRSSLFEMINQTPWLDWLLLTKRPHNVMTMTDAAFWESDNRWLGITAENQEMWEKRYLHAAKVPAKVRFVSAEPLLGRINFDAPSTDELTGCADDDLFELGFFHWVICGGESGPKAREFDPQNAHKIMKRCEGSNVAFWMKQFGSNPLDRFNDFKPVTLDSHGTDWHGYSDLKVRQLPAGREL